MLVVEKARHIEVEIRGPGADSVLAILRCVLPSLEASDDDLYEPVKGSEWFSALAAEVTPGAPLRVYRDNAGWTQAQLSGKTGIPIPPPFRDGKRPSPYQQGHSEDLSWDSDHI